MTSLQNEIAQVTLQNICQLAITKNKAELTKLLNNGICLSQFFGSDNAVTWLAKNNNVTAVKFLLKEFHLSPNHAVYGFARAGNTKEVDKLIARGASKNLAVIGFAEAGSVLKVEQLIAQGANRNEALAGYAKGGHREEVNKLLMTGASRQCAINGYAHSGNTKQIDNLNIKHSELEDALYFLAKGGHVKEVDALLARGVDAGVAIRGYAAGGYSEKVNLLLAAIPPGNKLASAYESALFGYALAGNVAEVDQLIAREGLRFINKAVRFYAKAGHVQQVNDLLGRGGDRASAILGYAISGHIKEVNQLIVDEIGIVDAVNGYENGGYLNKDNILSLMSYTDDKTLRKALIRRLDPSGQLDGLYHKATHLNRLINEYKVNFEQANRSQSLSTKIWFLQGQQLVKTDRLIKDIYFHIGSLLTGLSAKETKKIFDLINKDLYFQAMESSMQKYKLSIFSRENYLQTHADLDCNYVDRSKISRVN